MTRRALRKRLAASIAVLGLMALGSALVQLGWVPGIGPDYQDRVESLVTTSLPLIVAIMATLLASWFQQRFAFVESLRRLWSHVVEAKLDAIAHTEPTATPAVDHATACRSLSRAIDEMRGVYRNVGESRQDVGLYPFEPLHDMRRALERIGPARPDAGIVSEARAEIEQAWNSLRFSFLDEFSPPEPTNPILERSSRDPRRTSSAPS